MERFNFQCLNWFNFIKHNYNFLLFTPFTETTRKCDSGFFKCGQTAQCINEANLCDGVYDCFNGQDEQDCRKFTLLILSSSSFPLFWL